MSLAWNILSGYSGYFSFGHAAFWGLGAYTVSRVTGLGAAASEGAGAYGQIIVTLGLSLILQNGGLIVLGSTPTGIRTPLSRSLLWAVLHHDDEIDHPERNRL